MRAITTKTVIIEKQEWMAENLNITNYSNGDVIPHVKDAVEWSNLTTGAWCYYDNNPSNEKFYGKLYNWYAVVDPRGIAPKGWHVPNDAEWTQLSDHFRGELKANALWDKPLFRVKTKWDFLVTEEPKDCGFSAFPGGGRFDSGEFAFIGEYCHFWTTSEYDFEFAWSRSLNNDYSGVSRKQSFKDFGFSIRCIKN